MNIILLLGSTLGLSSIIMAAYIDHSLGMQVSDKTLHGLLTAVRYHQLYAIIITMIGICMTIQINSHIQKWLARSALMFIIGIIFFSFSIYLSAILNIISITYFTPAGGVILMLGWAFIMRTALLKSRI